MDGIRPGTRIQMDKGERKELLEGISKHCNNPKRRSAENVLLIGKSGVGKSSLLNTLNSAIVGKYQACVHAGTGEVRRLDLKSFQNCGVDLHNVQGGELEDILTELVPRLPNIVDMDGLNDENTPELREIIELIIYGFIPWDISIKALLDQQKKVGVGKLSRVYSKPDEGFKITKVVFVQSCQDSVPTNLIDCLIGVLTYTNPETASNKYQGDVFVAVTKKDKAGSGNIEKTLGKKFKIEGSLGYNLKRMANYCDDNGYSDPTIATEALAFLTFLTPPKNPNINDLS